MSEFILLALPPVIQAVCIALLGLSLGSFCTVLIHRIPKKQSWWKGQERSKCPECKTSLKISDLVPLYSWLKSKGVCQHCQASIPKIYPLIELGVATACLLAYLFLGLNTHSLIVIAAIPFLTASLIIDFRQMILPNQLTAIVGGLAVLDIILSVTNNMPDWQLASLTTSLTAHAFPQIFAAVVFILFAWILATITKFITKRAALGMGDIKFFFVVGLWLGMPYLSAFAILSGILGIISSLLWPFISKTPQKSKVFPFGPSLILSLYILLLFQTSHLM